MPKTLYKALNAVSALGKKVKQPYYTHLYVSENSDFQEGEKSTAIKKGK